MLLNRNIPQKQEKYLTKMYLNTSKIKKFIIGYYIFEIMLSGLHSITSTSKQ